MERINERKKKYLNNKRTKKKRTKKDEVNNKENFIFPI